MGFISTWAFAFVVDVFVARYTIERVFSSSLFLSLLELCALFLHLYLTQLRKRLIDTDGVRMYLWDNVCKMRPRISWRLATRERWFWRLERLEQEVEVKELKILNSFTKKEERNFRSPIFSSFFTTTNTTHKFTSHLMMMVCVCMFE